MPTSSIYDIYKLKGVQPIFSEIEDKVLYLHAKALKKHACCPKCRCKHSIRKGFKIRSFHLPPIGSTPCKLKLILPRLRCNNCHCIFWMKLPFMKGKSRFTPAFADYVLNLLQFGTIKHVAKFVRVGWDMVKNIHKCFLKNRYRKISLKKIRYISIDEISLKKGHTYMTVITDIESGRVLYCNEGKDAKSISRFLRKLSKNARNLKAVSIDMSRSYQFAVKKYLPHTMIVFDRFHVMAIINKALDEVRKEEYTSQQYRCGRVMKGSRFLLLWNYEKLDVRKQERLSRLLQINKTLAKCYLFKEQFRMLWMRRSRKEAVHFLAVWLMDVLDSEIGPLKKAARTILHHWEGIVSYFKYKISNGKAEGINNKIKTDQVRKIV